MTHDILQSDLDIAKRLILAERPDAEVVEALVRRSVAPDKASQVVNDLRLGKLVRPADPVFPEFASAARSRATLPPSVPDPGRKASAAPKNSGAVASAPSISASSILARRLTIVSFSLLGMVACIGILYMAWVANQRYHATTAALMDQWESSSPKDEALRVRIDRRWLDAAESARWKFSAPPGDAAGRSSSPAAGLVLELQPDGLYIGHNLVTPRNAFRAVSEVIGFPTRTNRTDQPKTVIYAYDHHGLLVYSGEGAGDDAIMLDFDALGGTNGTTLPFAGTLKFETNLIHANTGAGELASIKKLGLSNPGSDAGTFRGRCNDLDLYFAYLKTPSRLSVIQINLKAPR